MEETPERLIFNANRSGAALPKGGRSFAIPSEDPVVELALDTGGNPTALKVERQARKLRHMTASSLSVTTYLVPPITVVLSWVFLAETPPAVAYVGGAMCLVGVAVARRKPRPGGSRPEPVIIEKRPVTGVHGG
jgi:hypothetical protein